MVTGGLAPERLAATRTGDLTTWRMCDNIERRMGVASRPRLGEASDILHQEVKTRSVPENTASTRP